MTNQIINRYIEPEFKICAFCNKLFYKNKWMQFTDLKKKIKGLIIKSVKLSIGYSNPTYKIGVQIPKHKINPGINVNCKAKLTVTATGEEGLITEEGIMDFKLSYTYCPMCTKRGTTYFESVLQLRNIPDHVLNEVRNSIEDAKSKGLHINKEKRSGEGIDLYLTKRRFARDIAHKLYTKYGGIFKNSFRVFSQDKQTGKVLYRVNAYYEYPKITKEEYVIFNDKIYKVTNLTTFLTGIDLISGKKVVVNLGKNIPTQVIDIHESEIVSVKPLKVIDFESYDSVKPKNIPSIEYKVGDKIKTTKLNDSVWILY